jgi:hypothetical protein
MTDLRDIGQPEDILLLRELFASEQPVATYTLHEKYRLSPGQVFAASSKLVRLGLVEFVDRDNDFQVSISDRGREFVIANASHIWARRDLYWKQKLPEKYARKRVSRGVYYCPAAAMRILEHWEDAPFFPPDEV